MNILAIDAGNTRIKWGLYDGVVSNVAGSEVNNELQAVMAAFKLPTLWVKSSAAACSVSNGYDIPEQLGSDRWAALIAAWHLTRSPCIVASAGTALTIDALSAKGEFLGGLIVPGLATMQASLSNNTQLPLVTSELGELGELADFPVNTHDAIVSGALRAMVGAILAQHMALTLHTGKPARLLLTGGDAAALQMLLPESELADNLVLLGLVQLDKELNA